jgi:two-component system response regulator DesR
MLRVAPASPVRPGSPDDEHHPVFTPVSDAYSSGPQPQRQGESNWSRPVIRVMIVEDLPLLRGALAALLSSERDLTVVAEVAGADLLAEAKHHRPDVIVIDIDRYGGGLASLRRLAGELPDSRILVISDKPTVEALQEALDIGVHGFVGQHSPAGRLTYAVRRVAAGERMIDHTLGAPLLQRATSPLTEREREVLRAAAEGGRSHDIARRLSLAPGTVRNYLSSIIRKTGARTRLEAIRRAREAGWF